MTGERAGWFLAGMSAVGCTATVLLFGVIGLAALIIARLDQSHADEAEHLRIQRDEAKAALAKAHEREAARALASIGITTQPFDQHTPIGGTP